MDRSRPERARWCWSEQVCPGLKCRCALWARWPSGLEHWTGDRVVLGSNPDAATSLRNFGNSVYPTLPVSFGGDTKSRWSLLSGVCARGKKNTPHSR